MPFLSLLIIKEYYLGRSGLRSYEENNFMGSEFEDNGITDVEEIEF